jgi:hypothetical protein
VGIVCWVEGGAPGMPTSIYFITIDNSLLFLDFYRPNPCPIGYTHPRGVQKLNFGYDASMCPHPAIWDPESDCHPLVAPSHHILQYPDASKADISGIIDLGISNGVLSVLFANKSSCDKDAVA